MAFFGRGALEHGILKLNRHGIPARAEI
jgi:hypothetical protein